MLMLYRAIDEFLEVLDGGLASKHTSPARAVLQGAFR
jgi:hypothetical protein